jgi:hypothetical protein
MEHLTDLIVTHKGLAEEELVPLLARFVRFTEDGDLVLLSAFEELPAESRVACVVLAIKALQLVGLRTADNASPAEVCALSGLPGGTVRPKLRALLRKRQVHRDSAGRYSVPVNIAHRTAELLRDAS